MKKMILALMLTTSFQAFAGTTEVELRGLNIGGSQQRDNCRFAREAISTMSTPEIRFLVECTPDRYGSYTKLSGRVLYDNRYAQIGLRGVLMTGPGQRDNCADVKETLSMMSTTQIQFQTSCERDPYDRYTKLSGVAIVE